MRQNRFALIATILLAIPLASSARAGDKADWPSFVGPDGTRTPNQLGHRLVDDLNEMEPAWVLKHHTSVGKGLYPSTLRRSRELGIEPFYGGASNPIAADGLIFLSYYRPDGKAEARAKGWRTVSDPTEYLPDWFFSVTADDILLAIDAETGKIRWEAVEKSKGLNRLAHKRAHWSVSPAYDKGRVYSMGSMGILYAYDARTGRKLWETSTSEYLRKLRDEHIKKKQLVWKHADDQSSLIVADDVVLVARRSLAGYDAKSGKHLWSIPEAIMSKHGTPSIWTRGDKTYVLTHTGTSGELRLIDPADGKIVWTYKGIGPHLGTVTVVDDIVILPFTSEKSDKTRRGVPALHMYGAMKLTLQGPEKLWVLPDQPAYWQHWHHDKGPRYRVAARDGKAYISIDMERDYIKGPKRGNLLVVDVKTGKILSEQRTRRGGVPCLFEDRILLLQDYAHSNPVTLSYWTADDKPRKLNGTMAMPYDAISGYYVPIEPIYYKGKIYCRSLLGMHCFDLRKPEPEQAGTIRMEIPARLTGDRTRQVSLFLRDGQISHAGLSGSSRIHAVDPFRLQWDGRQLSGAFLAAVSSPYNAERYAVKGRADKDGRLTGQITAEQDGFAQPIERSGKIVSINHQPNWMPPCTHLFVLEGAALNVDRKPGRLIVFLTLRNGEILKATGWADHTTKTMPAVFADKLKLEDGRLTGCLTVRYRADEWTTPLVESGTTAAAEYEIDCKLKGNGKLGSYTGTYGIEWSRSDELVGKVK